MDRADDEAPVERLWWEEADLPSPFPGSFELILREIEWPYVNDRAAERWADESGDEHLAVLLSDPPRPVPERIQTEHRIVHDGRFGPAAWRHDVGRDGSWDESLRVMPDGSWWLRYADEKRAGSGEDPEDSPGSIGHEWTRAVVLHPDLLIDNMTTEHTGTTELLGRPGLERIGRPSREDVPYDDPWPPGDACRLVVDDEVGVLLALSLSFEGELVTTLEVTSAEFNIDIDPAVFEPG